MPSLETYKRNLKHYGNTIGEAHKFNADVAMEATWEADPQSKVCYIYDYFHDDQPELNKGMTYWNTTKTKIDAKFIVTQYNTLSKDQVETHLQFKPSQKLVFEEGDELYYYQKDFAEKYGAEFPIGMYIDIPDDRGIYRKWLICAGSYGLSYIKYSFLPCTYHLYWIEDDGDQRIKRNMWVVPRSQNSYNSGLWTDQYMTTQENQKKMWLPLNSITEKLYYTNIDGSKRNQRMIISAPVPNPAVWQISKVENTDPIGIQKITFYQDSFDPNTDYVDLSTGEMYADYYYSSVEPLTPSNISRFHCDIYCNSNTIKVGGSYKLLTANVYNSDGEDVTDDYITDRTPVEWTCSIDGVDFTSSEMIDWQIYDKNKVKIKFIDKEKRYLTKILDIKCSINNELIGERQLEIAAL